MKQTFAVLLAIFSFFYLLPTAVAIAKSQPNTTSIFIVNLLLGWTLIGWAIALAWSFAK